MALLLGRVEHAWGLELTGFGRPFGLGRDRDGRLLVTDMDLHLVVRLDARLERFEWHNGSGGWQGPVPVASRRVDAAPPRQATPAAFNGPHSVDVDRHGDLYVTCYYGAAIHRVSASGEPLATIGRDVLTGPASAMFDAGGRLLVAEYAQNAVLVLDTAGRVMGRLRGVFDRPHMARALADGTIAVADTWNDRVQQFTMDGELMDETLAAPVARPVAVDPLPDGRLLITAWGDDRVLAVDRATSTIASMMAPGLDHPYDARWMDAGVVVADSHHARVLVLSEPPFPA